MPVMIQQQPSPSSPPSTQTQAGDKNDVILLPSMTSHRTLSRHVISSNEKPPSNNNNISLRQGGGSGIKKPATSSTFIARTILSASFNRQNSSEDDEVFKQQQPPRRTPRRSTLSTQRRTVRDLINEISSRPPEGTPASRIKRSQTLDRWSRGKMSKGSGYVPDYIRYTPKETPQRPQITPLDEKPQDCEETNKNAGKSEESSAGTSSITAPVITTPPSTAAAKGDSTTYPSSPTLRRLRERSNSDETHRGTVPVQSAIKSMERNCVKASSVKISSTTTSISNNNTKISTTTSSTANITTIADKNNNKKPPKVTSSSAKVTSSQQQQRNSGVGILRHHHQGRISRNQRNRRSMSDPNLQKTFLEVKKLWDEKDKKVSTTPSSSVAAATANSRYRPTNDILNRRTVGIKPCLVNNKLATCETTANSASNIRKKYVTSTSLRHNWATNVSKTPNRRFDYDKSFEQVSKEVKEQEITPHNSPSTIQSPNTISTTTSNNSGGSIKERSSVFQTAQLFGQTGRPRSPFTHKNNRSEPSSLSASLKEKQEKEAKKEEKEIAAQNTLATKKQAEPTQEQQEDDETTESKTDSDLENNNTTEKQEDIMDKPTKIPHPHPMLPRANTNSFLARNRASSNASSVNSDVTNDVINQQEVATLQRNGSTARERRKSNKMKSRHNSSSSGSCTDNTATAATTTEKSATDQPKKEQVAPRLSFLHRPSHHQTVVRRSTLPSSDGNMSSTRSSTTSSNTSHDALLDVCVTSQKRLSGAEEMIERRLERFKRDPDTSPVRSRPNLLDIRARSRAHTLEPDQLDNKGMTSSEASTPTTSMTSSSGMRPDSISSNMSTTSGEFNLASEYDKIAQQVALDNDVTEEVRNALKRNVDTQGVRNSVEVPSKQKPHGVEVGHVEDDWCPAASTTESDSGVVNDSNIESNHDEEAENDEVDEASEEQVVPQQQQPQPPTTQQEPVPLEKKLFNIANELLSTEETYVEVLYLIDQVFRKKVVEAVEKNKIIPEAVVAGIFGQISPIYTFHSQHLIKRLRERIGQWEEKPMIGDIMQEAAPFMKMYSLYVQQFNESMDLIKTWYNKSSQFANIMHEIHKMPTCGGLDLKHHMLTPVQRIPRYQLLLEDYFKRLPQDSMDYEPTSKAVELIRNAAKHSNETIQKLEKFHKLVQIFNHLSDVNFDIVDVSRELYKEGKIIKISARSGEKHDRYLYLFSDMLVCCAPLTRLVGNKNYRVTAKIDLEGMHVSDEGSNQQHTFCVRGLQKTMEFQASNEEEKDKWITALNSAIDEYDERKSTFRTNRGGSMNSDPPPLSPMSHITTTTTHDLVCEAELGIRAPRWIKDHNVTMCMVCSKSFNKIVRRRHHCRACGRVVCSECSEHKIILQYEPTKNQRICTNCYKILTGRQQHLDKNKGVLEVEGDELTENSVIADYLHLCENEKKKNWNRMWCVIPNDQLCVYFYAAKQDVRAQSTLPLPGFTISKVTTSSSSNEYMFKIIQGRKVMYFSCQHQLQMERWIYAISHASRGEDLTRDLVYNLGKTPTPTEVDTTPISPPNPSTTPDEVPISPTTSSKPVKPTLRPPPPPMGTPQRAHSSSSEEDYYAEVAGPE